MVNATREPLYGDVEIDDTWIGGPQPVCEAVGNSKGERPPLRWWPWNDARSAPVGCEWRLSRTPNKRRWLSSSSTTSRRARPSTPTAGLHRRPERLRGGPPTSGTWPAPTSKKRPARRRSLGGAARDRAIGNLQWLIGTYHGVGRHHLPIYLDEFVFRHNRRTTPMAAFQIPLGLGTKRGPTPGSVIRGGRDLPQFPIKT